MSALRTRLCNYRYAIGDLCSRRSVYESRIRAERGSEVVEDAECTAFGRELDAEMGLRANPSAIECIIRIAA